MGDKKVIYVDMDNTLLDSFEFAMKYAQKSIFGGASHTTADIKLRRPKKGAVFTNSTTSYLEACGMTHNEAVLMRQYLFKSREYWENISFVKDAYDVFKWLYDIHDVYIATSVFLSDSNECILGKLRFVEKKLPWFDRSKLIYSHAKYRLSGDFFIEDVWSQIETFNGTRILFDRPYNQDDKPDVRVYN
ncbi:MAG: 5' nucleotidase, NT5C type, partial [Promethearchaeota archaeon]